MATLPFDRFYKALDAIRKELRDAKDFNSLDLAAAHIPTYVRGGVSKGFLPKSYTAKYKKLLRGGGLAGLKGLDANREHWLSVVDDMEKSARRKEGKPAKNPGERKHIARRTLADDKVVLLWPDGQITYAFGYTIRGVGKAREPWAREADLKAGWAFMDDAGLFDSSEAPTAIKAIRKAFRDPYHGRPGFKGGEPGSFHTKLMVDAVEKAKRRKKNPAAPRKSTGKVSMRSIMAKALK